MSDDGAGPDALLLDVEGTTTPPSFVYDVLFPYSRAELPSFVRRHAGNGVLGDELDQLEAAAGRRLDTDEAVAELVRLIDSDSKLPALKAVQGKIWASAYREGAVQGAVYADVAPALRRWRARGVPVYIYSSGSVLSQRLLFEHSTAGDLTPLLAGYFDTEIGPKRERESYVRIAAQLGVSAGRALFVSDTPAELDAARAAGLDTALCLRDEPNPTVGAHANTVIRNFDEL